MSNWIRIDDDTYIDDSLVTCAEYQLFINEMRAQGKYHQPDHWVDYHFSKGQAKNPILGVRGLDSVIFCEWLSQNDKNWRYRIPNDVEGNQFPGLGEIRNSLGYWVSKNSGFGFVWANLSDRDAKFNEALVHTNLAVQVSGPEYIGPYSGQQLQDEYDELLHSNMSYGSHEEFRFSEIEIAFRQIAAQNYFKGLVDNLEHKLELYFDRSKPSQIRTYDLIKNEIKEIYELTKSFYYDSVGKPDYRSLKSPDFTYLYDLENRKTGTSPAFEGIRLVRERIK
ncbi:MAG: hypothetical protein RBS68_02305 [Anaerolineales bacterium]|jgi:hypothetical protein|nr:hypothetical protein [Anaerolineales bacterium]